MTTFGYELRLVKDLLPGHLARQWHVPSSILSPRPVPRPTSLVPRPKFNEFSIRPSRALTVWQIQHPAGVDGPSLAQLSAVESKMDAHRAQAMEMSRASSSSSSAGSSTSLAAVGSSSRYSEELEI